MQIKDLTEFLCVDKCKKQMSFVPFLGMKKRLLEAGCGWCCGERMSCWDNITLQCAGWHRGPDLEWKTGHELNLIQKSPVMPTSACVTLQRASINDPVKFNQQMTAEKASPIVPKKDRNEKDRSGT